MYSEAAFAPGPAPREYAAPPVCSSALVVGSTRPTTSDASAGGWFPICAREARPPRLQRLRPLADERRPARLAVLVGGGREKAGGVVS